MKLSHRRFKKANKKAFPTSRDLLLIARGIRKQHKRDRQLVLNIQTGISMAMAAARVHAIRMQPRPIEMDPQEFARQKAMAICEQAIQSAVAVGKLFQWHCGK